MNWSITAGRPVYVQLVEQLELALVAGEFPPGSRIPPVRSWPPTRASIPTRCSVPCRNWKAAACCRPSAPAGRTVTADDAALHALRRRRAQTLAGEFLHQMHALSLTETEIETLLRETAQQQTEE